MGKSENENEKRETLADIVSELRVLSDKWIADKSMTKTECLGLISHQIADRIEAAWEREKAESEANALAVGGIVEAERQRVVVSKTETTTVGNAAALREALVALRDAARNFCHQILNSKYNDIMDEYKCRERGIPALLDLRYAIPKANFALAAPARNCDVLTHDEALEVWAAENENECNGCLDEWLYHVAAERIGCNFAIHVKKEGGAK